MLDIIGVVYLIATRKSRAAHAAQYNKYRKGYQVKSIKAEAAAAAAAAAPPVKDTREYTPKAVSPEARDRARVFAAVALAGMVGGLGVLTLNYELNRQAPATSSAAAMEMDMRTMTATEFTNRYN